MLFVWSEELIHLCDFMQHKESTPHDGRARWSVVTELSSSHSRGSTLSEGASSIA
ncbi:MAG: hypothetical protein CBHOC_2033 [uncultured Caballeronia sp.]|nr:MAG: hypothetical protein CBHOC_2033 [uncultured Caballeronia sp.]